MDKNTSRGSAFVAVILALMGLLAFAFGWNMVQVVKPISGGRCYIARSLLYQALS
jgi:hypothetical protein